MTTAVEKAYTDGQDALDALVTEGEAGRLGRSRLLRLSGAALFSAAAAAFLPRFAEAHCVPSPASHPCDSPGFPQLWSEQRLREH